MKNFLTQEGYQKLQDELSHLKKVKRKEIAEKIKDFQDFGDINENSELDETRNEQAFLEGKIQKLEYLVRNAQIIDPEGVPFGKNNQSGLVRAGSKVILLAKKETIEYILVGSAESDPGNGKISIESPLGQALYGRKKGEKVSIDTISGPSEYQIVDIK